MAAAPAPPAEWNRLRSPLGLSRAVAALLGAVVVTDVVALAAGANIRREYKGLGGTLPFDPGPAIRAENLYGMAGGLQTLALLATAVVFIIWFHRVRVNAEVFDAGVQPMRPGWAIGAWFVPFGNLWLPRRVAGGVWAASARTDRDGSRRAVSHAPLDLWWTLWVVATLFSQVATRIYAHSELPSETRDAVALVMAADALDIAAAVLAILLVRKLTRMQGERAALGATPLSAPSPTGPAPV
ncbi:DUF4328 domain-containing protein [Streptomyces sp. QL37]|uniref:DUF4328 domain-containing protein n=1 Tax=Streptomyces sp. QL37 TaxID=2093747 RepID=UPI0021CB2BD2|nr:DUF4328 domain-containing protein [Streptomyces sp. QL37]